jgi:RNA-directed DNA polymerase
VVEQFLKERGLMLSEAKTQIVPITQGFDFLGQNVRQYNGVLLITPSKANRKAFLDKVRAVIKANPQARAGTLVQLLNPLIRGWTNYHRYVVSKKTFSLVADALFRALWQWAKRRHPKKSRYWVKDKYFRTVGGNHWVFYGDWEGKTVTLMQPRYVPITRQVKVKGQANPYDPEWESYFERRLDVKIADTLRGRRTLLRLWKEQDGLCPVCNQKISEVTGWHSHHIIWRSLGGPDTVENRVLLHPTCHSQVHAQKLTVEKPRPATGV